MEKIERELMRDQVAATLAAGVMAAENKQWEPATAATLMREVRDALYPPGRVDFDLMSDPTLARFIAEEFAKLTNKGELPALIEGD